MSDLTVDNGRALPDADSGAPVGLWQMAAIAVCFFVYICDGMDIASIAYAAPALMKAWGLGPWIMGVVLSAGTAGLVAGASAVAILADRFGRRTVIVLALFEVAVAMMLVATANSVGWLIALRFITGVGVGALVPALNVLMVEYAAGRRGSFFLSVGHVGYALGAVIGAAIGALVVGPWGWRAIFSACAMITTVIAVFSLALLPESLSFILTRQPNNALARANALLERMKRPLLLELPEKAIAGPRRNPMTSGLFRASHRNITLLLWVVSFAYYFTAYFLYSWIPQILVSAGLTNRTAISSGVVTGFAAAAGALAIGALAVRWEARLITCGAFVMTAIGLIAFALAGPQAVLLLSLAGAVMFASQATYTGSVIVAARVYPADIRTTGVGFMIGIGRLGAIAGPFAAGAFMGAGWSRLSYYSVFAAMCLLGALAVVIRPSPPVSSPLQSRRESP